MQTKRTCAKCGAPYSGGALEGLCPNCVGRLAFLLAPDPVPPAEDGTPQPSKSKLRYFGDYELLEEIARGGMGVVYKARQLSLNRIVAVKMILAGQLASEAEVQRFLAEAEAAANLQYPNIVAIHEISEHEGQHYFSMDYVEGKSLAQVGSETRERGREWFRRVAGWLKTIAEAIHYAHEQGTLHRDLKPSNVLIDANGQPWITDFGLARRIKHDSDLTATGAVLGTPNFMPPEQAAADSAAIGPSSDVYSLGAVLYFLLTAEPPFSAATIHETVTKVLTVEPVRPRLKNPAVPPDLQTICLKCLEKSPRGRYASAKEMADDLGRFLEDRPIEARPIGMLESFWRHCRRRPAVTSLGFGLLITVAALVVVLALLANKGTVRPIPVRGGNGISAAINGKIYVTTPMDGFGSGAGYFYAYDPGENVWSPTLEATPAVHIRPCGGAIGSKFYLAGGLSEGRTLLDRLDIYDTVSEKWSQGRPMLTARQGAAGVVLDGRLYALGGAGADGEKVPLAEVEVYDPKTDLWTSFTKMPTPRMYLGAAVLDGTIYAVGGKNGENSYLRTLEALKPDGHWIGLNSLLRAVSGPFVAARNGIIYVAGGQPGNGEVTDSLQVYSVATGRWTLLAPMPRPRFDGCGAQWVGGRLFLLGGWTYHPEALPHYEMFVFDTARNVWRK